MSGRKDLKKQNMQFILQKSKFKLRRLLRKVEKNVVMNEPSKDIHYWLEKSYYDCIPYFPPVKLDICLTTACNTKCAYCWQQEKKGSLLTFDAVSKVIDAMRAIKPPQKLSLTGGEPTIWPDFERLVNYASNSGIKNILLCTNGRRLVDLNFANKIVALGVTDINISVDTLNPEKFKMLRGYDFSEFEKIVHNCILLKKKYRGLSVALCSVMSKLVTPEDLLAVRNLSNKYKFGYFMQTFDKTDYVEVNNTFMLTKEERDTYNKKLDWLDGKLHDTVSRDINPLIEDGKIKCYKGITTVKLSSDGSIAFCWNSQTIGNILHDPFIDIWTSARARETRKYIRDKKCSCDFDCDIFESLELLDL